MRALTCVLATAILAAPPCLGQDPALGGLPR